MGFEGEKTMQQEPPARVNGSYHLDLSKPGLFYAIFT